MEVIVGLVVVVVNIIVGLVVVFVNVVTVGSLSLPLWQSSWVWSWSL